MRKTPAMRTMVSLGQLVLLFCCVHLPGCGNTATPAPTPTPPSTTVTVLAPPAPAATRVQVIAQAEAFVRAQGYASTPPTATGDALVHEGIEGSIVDRLNTLDPHAVHSLESGGVVSVVFRYVDPQYAGRGRMLRLTPGQTPSFVHQDVMLSAFRGQEPDPAER
jgi:hypothetical protein